MTAPAAPVASPSSPFASVMTVVTFAAGLGLLAFGAITHNSSVMLTGAGIIVPVAMTSHVGQVVLAHSKDIRNDLAIADKLLPVIPMVPPNVQAILHTILGDTESAMDALAAGGVPAPSPLAQAAAAAVAAPVAPAGPGSASAA